MSKTINNIVWEIFIEETMGQEKSELYTDRITDYTEDMCYIIYTKGDRYELDYGKYETVSQIKGSLFYARHRHLHTRPSGRSY